MSTNVPSPNDTYLSPRQKIDEEIASLEAQIVQLKTTRNTLAPVSRLHFEIIQEIFVLLARESPPKERRKKSLHLTWVCHSWRELALETSQLWTHIDFLCPEWVEAALSRSRDRELSFSFVLPPGYDDNRSGISSLALANLHRIRALTIRPAWNARMKQFAGLSPLWVNPAPVLVELNLRCVSLPTSLFSGTSPALQTLILESCQFTWESLPIHPGIRTFFLVDPLFKISVDDFVQKMHIIALNLVHLKVRHALLPLTNPSTHILRSRQPLLNIKEFGVDDELATVMTWIFDQFALPLGSHSNVRISMQGGVEQLDTVRSFVASRGLDTWPVKHLDINAQEEEFNLSIREKSPLVDLDQVDTSDEEGDWDWDSESYSDNNISLVIERSGHLSNIIPVLQLLPLPPIESLSLSGGPFGIHVPDLIEYFHVQGRVKWLDVAVDYVPILTKVLYAHNLRIRRIVGAGDVADLGAETQEQIRGVISFHHLSALRYYGLGDSYAPPDRQFYTILAEWLGWRKAAGIGLESLVFMNMVTLPASDLNMLFSLITKVELNDVTEVVGDDGDPFVP